MVGISLLLIINQVRLYGLWILIPNGKDLVEFILKDLPHVI